MSGPISISAVCTSPSWARACVAWGTHSPLPALLRGHTGRMSTRRALRYLTIAPVAALFLALQVVAPASACACGAPAPRPGQDVIVDKEHAILSWDGSEERIELLLDMLTDA